MKSFTMVLLAATALALPAFAEQRDTGDVSRNDYRQTHQERDWRREQTDSMRQRVRAEDLSSDQIRKIQRALKDAGRNVGNIDGKWGPNTRQALKDFQERQGMVATGRLNGRVIGALGLDPQRFASGEFRRYGSSRSDNSGLRSNSERGHLYGYGGRDRNRDYYGRKDRDRDYDRDGNRDRDDYSLPRGERY